MRAPAEFDHLVHCFYQGSDEEVSTIEEWVALAVGHLNRAQRDTVLRFLNEWLSRSPSGAELQRVWEEAGPDYSFPNDDQLRNVLSLIRDTIAQKA